MDFATYYKEEYLPTKNALIEAVDEAIVAGEKVEFLTKINEALGSEALALYLAMEGSVADIITELAEIYGENEAKVKALVEEGKVMNFMKKGAGKAREFVGKAGEKMKGLAGMVGSKASGIAKKGFVATAGKAKQAIDWAKKNPKQAGVVAAGVGAAAALATGAVMGKKILDKKAKERQMKAQAGVSVAAPSTVPAV